MKDFFQRFARVQNLFPRGFTPFLDCLEHGVASIRLDRWKFFDIPASYDAEAKEIMIDPDMNREKLADVLSRRHGIRVLPEEVPAWIFLHELGHHVRGDSQVEAEMYAKERFLEWKRSR